MLTTLRSNNIGIIIVANYDVMCYVAKTMETVQSVTVKRVIIVWGLAALRSDKTSSIWDVA